MLHKVLCTSLSTDAGDFRAVNFSSGHRSHISEANYSPHRNRLCLITSVPGLRGVTTQHSTAVKARCPQLQGVKVVFLPFFDTLQ